MKLLVSVLKSPPADTPEEGTQSPCRFIVWEQTGKHSSNAVLIISFQRMNFSTNFASFSRTISCLQLLIWLIVTMVCVKQKKWSAVMIDTFRSSHTLQNNVGTFSIPSSRHDSLVRRLPWYSGGPRANVLHLPCICILGVVIKFTANGPFIHGRTAATY